VPYPFVKQTLNTRYRIKLYIGNKNSQIIYNISKLDRKKSIWYQSDWECM